jgi:hypothetical protein
LLRSISITYPGMIAVNRMIRMIKITYPEPAERARKSLP